MEDRSWVFFNFCNWNWGFNWGLFVFGWVILDVVIFVRCGGGGDGCLGFGDFCYVVRLGRDF